MSQKPILNDLSKKKNAPFLVSEKRGWAWLGWYIHCQDGASNLSQSCINIPLLTYLYWSVALDDLAAFGFAFL
jgi:hypothetical protein